MMDNIKESVISSQFRSDDDNEDETTYNYDDELVMDSDDDAVQAGETFIEDGREWQWIKQIGDVEHIDFDNWAVWFATDVDTQDGGYFIVDIDTGFIDWGPVDTEGEAKEFLQSKVDDEDEEDIDFSITDYEDDYYVDESVETILDQENKTSLEDLKEYKQVMKKHMFRDDLLDAREQAINRIISVYEDASDDYQDYIVSELVRLSGFPDESYIGGIDIDEPVWERISDKQLKWLDNTISLNDRNKRKNDKKINETKESLSEDKGQPRSNRYRTYFNRIKRAIEKGDEETLKRTKEAIMYAPAKELKNSEADELMDMIKNRKITESISGKYGKVKYVPRRDGMHGESAIYANYYLFLDDGKYTPYWAGERPMGRSYSSVEDAVKGIDAFIDRQHKDGKMLHMKPVNEASYGGAYDNEAKNIINVLNKNLRVRFKHSAGGIFFLDRTPFNEDTFNELIKNNYKMIGDILEEQGLKYDISEDAYISKDTNLYVTIYGDTNGIIVQFEEMESESLKESVNSDIVSMIKKQFPEATVKTSVRKHSDVHKSNPDTPVGKTKYVDIKIMPDSASSVNSILQYCNHNIKKVLDSNSRFYYYGDVPARNPRGSKEVVLSYQDYSGLSDDEYKSLLGESVNPADLTDCPACGDISFDSKHGRCTKCSYREELYPINESSDDRVRYYRDMLSKCQSWEEVYDISTQIKNDPQLSTDDEYNLRFDVARNFRRFNESKSIKEEHDILSANELADKVFTALNNCNISGYGNYIDRANDSVQLYPEDEDISEEITDCLKSDFVFEIDRYGHIIVTDLKSLLEPKESLNLDSEGKRLKKAISQLVLDSDEELRDYVNKIIDEVIEERNGDLDDNLSEDPQISNAELNEDIDVDSDRNSVYYKVLSKLSAGVATSKIYNQPNVGLTFDIEPTDDAINKVVSKLKSLGFTEVDRYEDDNYLNDSYIVFTNEINGERVVCGIVYNARNNFAFVTAGYDEAEDSEYFDSYKNATQESYKLGALNRYKESLLDEDIDIDSNEDIDVEETNQKYTSAKTSINSSKIPAIFNMINLQPGTINLDFGGGKFDNVAEYLADKDVTNLVYDPYNRSSEHNKEVIDQVKANGGADSATISNVLNVIAEESARNIVLNNVYRLTKPDATIYITVYEGDSSGNPGETKSGYQLNRKTADYMEEIEKVFPNVVRKGKLIIAKK